MTKDTLLSQFKLSIDTYRDQNHFLIYNKVTNPSSRYFIWKKDYFYFLNILTNTAWLGKPLVKEDTIIDLSQSNIEKKEKSTYILGLYFFYGDSHFDHSRQLFTFMDLLSKFGGLYGSIFQLLGIIGSFYNSKMFIGELIGRMYFLKVSSTENDSSKSLKLNATSMSKNIKKIKFSGKDVFSYIKFEICTKICRKRI